MSKKSLVVDARMINSSGIGVYLKNILPRIAIEFDLVLLGERKELNKFHWTKNLTIIDFNWKIYSLKEQIYFPIKIPKTDLFWCPHFNAPLLPIKAKKILTTIHDVNHLANKESNSFIKWAYAKLLYSSAVKKSIRIITVSEFSKNELVKFTRAPKDKISIIYNGVDYGVFTKKKESNIKNLPKKYILYVGNIKPHKNLITLLKAYNRLSKKTREEFKLVILGKKEGFITPDLEIFKFIEKNDLMKDTFFTGYISDEEVPAIYQKAKLFVFPSLYEGFGLPILEAMISEVPVLSSNRTSLPEVGGDAVIYFDPMNVNELAEKIEKYILNTELLNPNIVKGKLQAKLFSWEKASKEHVLIIKQLLN